MVLLDILPVRIQNLFQEEGTTIKIDKGHPIFYEGENAEDIFFIHSGIIQIAKGTESGKELTIRICGKGTIIGECHLFCSSNIYTTTAKAIEPSMLYILSKKTLELYLLEHQSLMLEYMRWLQIENTKHQSRLRDLVMHGKKGALFSTLVRLSNTYGQLQPNGDLFINYSLTNSDLANLCATSREMINRMLNDLKKLNILSFQKGFITIHHIDYLKSEMDCPNCPSEVCRID